MMVPVISVDCHWWIAGNSRWKTRSFLCPCMQMCSLRLQFADLFHDLPLLRDNWHTKLLSIRLELFISPKLVVRMSFFQRQTNDSYCFISELMDVFFRAGVHQQPELSNYLAEGQI